MTCLVSGRYGSNSRRKAAQVKLRLPRPLLDAVKERAKLRGIPYTRFIREVLEREISRPDKLR